MKRLNTPLGEIAVMIDGRPIDYTAQKGPFNDVLWPDVKDRYQIEVRYVPDGKEHSLSTSYLGWLPQGHGALYLPFCPWYYTG